MKKKEVAHRHKMMSTFSRGFKAWKGTGKTTRRFSQGESVHPAENVMTKFVLTFLY